MSMMAANYAQALYGLAKDEKLEHQILDQLQSLQTAFETEPDFLRLLATPNLSKDERCEILDNSLRGKIHPYVLNFMKILTKKGYIRRFSECSNAYQSLYDVDNGILKVQAVTAVDLTQSQYERLREKLEGVTGKKIRLQNRVDPDCLGGVRLDYDGKRLDGTVQTRLNTIRDMLKNTVL